jgi:LysR family glycine cleavage system transcriptional activator
VAARHLSFTRAAAELFVTQTAISHQIRGLEEQLGVRLFRRLPRGLVLTEEGQRFWPPVHEAFGLIARATEELGRDRKAGALTVTALPSFAAKWLVPRLGRFRTAHPDVDLRLSASMELVDLARSDVDAAIRLGRGDYPGLRVDRLFGESLVPVCSPALLEGASPLRTPADLRNHTLLHDVDIAGIIFPQASDAWRLWLEAAGITDVDPAHGSFFEDASLQLEAAAAGQGVALGRTVLAAADLASGRLVVPFDLRLPFELAYFFVCPETVADRPRIAAFRSWLLEEAAREPAAA